MKLVILIVALFLVGNVYADDGSGHPGTGPYIGGAFNWVNYDGDDLDDIDDIPGISVDDSDNGWKLFGGYNFHQNFGVEASYYDLGEIGVSGPGGNLDVDVEAFGLHAIAKYEGEIFSAFGKLGAVNVEFDQDDLNLNDDDTVVSIGAGLLWHQSSPFALRLEWEYFDEVEDIDASIFSAGIQYNF